MCERCWRQCRGVGTEAIVCAEERCSAVAVTSSGEEEEVEHDVVEESKKSGSRANGALDGEEEVRVQT